jgi:NADH-quinone oxidoreductase subunit C
MAGSFLDAIRVAASDFGAELTIDSRNGLRVSVSAKRALGLLTWLREAPESSMRRLVDLTAIDLEGKPRRFEVVYRLHSPGLNESIRVHVELDESSLVIDSVVEQWPDANWLEREVFDFFGIEFRAHPDLRRILLDQDFEGSPLRKDYPRQPNLALPKAVKA